MLLLRATDVTFDCQHFAMDWAFEPCTLTYTLEHDECKTDGILLMLPLPLQHLATVKLVGLGRSTDPHSYTMVSGLHQPSAGT